jgi:hypothetical protein
MSQPTKETFMTTITIGRRLVPREQIVLVEPFDAAANPLLRSDRMFKTRIVLLNRDTILTEETPMAFAEANAFRPLIDDGVFTNPTVHFSVEAFHPAEGFNPRLPYLSRLVWRDLDSNVQSKLLLSKPEDVLRVAVRGEIDVPSQAEALDAEAAFRRPVTRRRNARKREERAPIQG